MHTPRDRNWRDEASRVRIADGEERIHEVARIYLAACHQADLEVVAITDHNFAPAGTIPFVYFLREQNEAVARSLGRSPIIIFPGFEIQADVGKGCHVICLFDPSTDLTVVESRITECGLPADKRFKTNGEAAESREQLDKIIKIVQRQERNPGLVIAAHPTSAKGMLSDDVAEMWLQQVEFKNEDLLCIEVPKPPAALSDNLQKLLGAKEGCDAAWRRERPIACVQVSDCYDLRGTPEITSNYIGFRSTWIKMSEPTIEGLRQAFLDHSSRIRYCQERPESRLAHPFVTRVEVSGATFYRAGPIFLSANLNTLIGSRGAGKSTLMDYIRMTLDRLRPRDLPPKLRDEILSRVAGTLQANSTITIEFQHADVPYRVQYVHPAGERQITRLDTSQSEPEWSIRELLPIRILSQREIDQSVDPSERTALRTLLDDFVAPQLATLRQIGLETQAAVKALDAEIETKEQGQSRRPTLTTQKLDLQTRLDRLDSVRKPLEHWTGIETEDGHLRTLLKVCASIETELQNALNRLPALPLEPEPASAHGDLLREAHTAAVEGMRGLRDSIQKALIMFRNATCGADGALSVLIAGSWNPIYDAERIAYEALKQKLEERGDKPQDYLKLRGQLTGVEQQLLQLDEERGQINRLAESRGQKLAELQGVWHNESAARTAKAQELMSRLRPRQDSKPLVEIDVVHQGDAESAARIWCTKLGDRRRLNELDIEQVVNHFASSDGEEPLPRRMLRAVRDNGRTRILETLLSARAKVFCEIYSEPVLRQLELERIEDRVTYNVYREDGTLAGPIDSVSAGQKGLAFLNLLLASGDMPLLVDTPEEGLDNEGVYAELVPILRREKEKRQILVVTHNANIPVNADAELIACLEPCGTIDEAGLIEALRTAGGPVEKIEVSHIAGLVSSKEWDRSVSGYLGKKGWEPDQVRALIAEVSRMRTVEGRIRRTRITADEKLRDCIGALDKAVVKQAVQDIMEGSEKAFIRRREKYGF
jgi:ABC-type uncharacterized transport system ATPase subunit